jgi:hypothetical protein
MEITMLYKTIVLELLKQNPKHYTQLRTKRMVLPTLNRYARKLKASHETWKDRLTTKSPGSDEKQLASEALELALQEMESCLGSELPTNLDAPRSPGEAMAIRRGKPPRR